jgi:hypothetical protein
LHLASCGINYLDVYQRSGRYRLPLPYTPGFEGIRRIRQLGEGARAYGFRERRRDSHMRMRAIAVAVAVPILVSTSWAQDGSAKQERNSKTMQPSDVINVEGTNLVAPALEKYAHGPVAELWNRPV